MTPRKIYSILFLVFFIYCLSCLNCETRCEDSFKEQASLYRKQGYEAQKQGNYSRAISFYQKAIQLAPSYAVAYNDLGVVYERMELLDKAENSYKKAIELDPHYVATYTNLALFYEKGKKYQEATQMWRKRAELGDPFGTGTHRARQRLEDLAKTDKHLYKIYEEYETLELIDEVKDIKANINDGSQLASEVYFRRGRDYYERGKYVQALRELHRALNIDPHNKEAEELLIKAQKRALITP